MDPRVCLNTPGPDEVLVMVLVSAKHSDNSSVCKGLGSCWAPPWNLWKDYALDLHYIAIVPSSPMTLALFTSSLFVLFCKIQKLYANGEPNGRNLITLKNMGDKLGCLRDRGKSLSVAIFFLYFSSLGFNLLL